MSGCGPDVLPDGFDEYLSRCAYLEKSESACLKMCKKLFEIGPYYLSEWLLRVEDQLEWRINKRSKANADFIDLAKDPKTKTRNNDKGIRTTLSNSNGA